MLVAASSSSSSRSSKDSLRSIVKVNGEGSEVWASRGVPQHSLPLCAPSNPSPAAYRTRRLARTRSFVNTRAGQCGQRDSHDTAMDGWWKTDKAGWVDMGSVGRCSHSAVPAMGRERHTRQQERPEGNGVHGPHGLGIGLGTGPSQNRGRAVAGSRGIPFPDPKSFLFLALLSDLGLPSARRPVQSRLHSRCWLVIIPKSTSLGHLWNAITIPT